MTQSTTKKAEPGVLEYFHEGMETMEVDPEAGQIDTLDLGTVNPTAAEIPVAESSQRHTAADIEFANQPTADLLAEDASDTIRLRATLEGGILIMKRTDRA